MYENSKLLFVSRDEKGSFSNEKVVGNRSTKEKVAKERHASLSEMKISKVKVHDPAPDPLRT